MIEQQILEAVQAQMPGIRVSWENDPDPFDRYVVLVAIDSTDETKRASIRIRRAVLNQPLDEITQDFVDLLNHCLIKGNDPDSE